MSFAPAHKAFRAQAALHSNRGLLRSKDFGQFPLSGVIVESQVHWFCARVTVRLEFRNPTSDTIDAFAAFDVPEHWSVASYRADIDNQSVVSQYSRLAGSDAGGRPVVSTRTEASAAAGSARLFTADVPWPLVGGQCCLVTIVFFCPVKEATREGLQLSIPKILIPMRSVKAAGGEAEESQSWKSLFVLPAVSRLPKSLLIHGKGTLYCAAAAAPSVSLPGAVASKQADPRRIEFKYDNRDHVQQPPNDFDITVKIVPDEDPVMIHAVQDDNAATHDDERYALALSIAPPAPAAHLPANVEVIVLVDNSGSMVHRAARVASAVRAFVHGLPSTTVVNVGLFAENTTWLLPESAVIDDNVLARIDSGLAQHANGKGGQSKLYRAVADAYLRPVVVGYARVFVLVTDGSEPEPFHSRLLELAAANRHTSIFCSVPIGPHADAKALGHASALTSGTSVPVTNDDALLAALVQATKPHLVPHLTFMRVAFAYDGVDERPPVKLCADHLPLLKIGQRGVVYAFGHRTLRGCTARVSGLVGGEQREYALHTGPVEKSDVERDAMTNVSLVHAAAAAQRIDTLVNLNDKSTPSAAEREEITRLSLRFQIPSPYTELRPATGTISYPFNDRRDSFPLPASLPYRDPITGAAKDADTIANPELCLPKLTQRVLGWQPSQQRDDDVKSGVFNLAAALGRQSANGSWSGDAAPFFGVTREELSETRPALTDDALWATAVFSAILSKKVAAGDPAVALAVEKSAGFLEGPSKAQVKVAAAEFTVGRS